MYSFSKERTANQARAETHRLDKDTFVVSVPHYVNAITNTDCNARCPFCFAWNSITRPKEDHTDLSARALDTLQHFIDRGMQALEFYGGGEVLLSDSFWRFLERYDRSGLRTLGILSNFSAPIRDPKLLAAKLDYVKISVSGATPEVYEKTMRASRWDQLMSNIEIAREAGVRTIWFICILQQSNKSQIRQLHELAVRCGAQTVVFKQLAPAVNQRYYDEENVAGEVLQLADQINSLKGRYPLRVYSDIEHGGTALLTPTPSVAQAKATGFVCKHPWSTFSSHLDGVVRPCCFNMTASYGNINTDDPETLWNGAAIRHFRSELSQLRYIENGCPADCPDLALQMVRPDEDVLVEIEVKEKL
jgi:MoaA/NifB/PqqE/SkfB family radical SAM enzyme